jgi:hypothetical protein
MSNNKKVETQKILIEVSVEDAKMLRMIAAKKNTTRFKYIAMQLNYICENERKRLNIKQVKAVAKKAV